MMEEVIKIIEGLIVEGEGIRNGQHENSWQKCERWEAYCIDVLTKHVTREEAEKFRQEEGQTGFQTPQMIRKRGDMNFINHVNAKLGFLKVLRDDIADHPTMWAEKLGRNK
jgi:hypothetical protein